MSLKGNRAVKIHSEFLTTQEQEALFSKEGFIYWNMLNVCDSHIKNMARAKNIDNLEYNALFSYNCGKYEKLFFGALRTKMREKIYNDQIKEFSGNYEGIYNPYNPYLQKYNGAYLRNYQQF